MSEPCFICQKHLGIVAPPPGGYIYTDAHWMVCHAPPHMAALGTLIVESRRHVLDFADMTSPETASYGPLLQRLYAAVKPLAAAERVYTMIMLEGTPHFHAWLIPRGHAAPERGVAFLARHDTCDAEHAATFTAQLRATLS